MRVPLQRDALASVEGRQVCRKEVAALVFPHVVVDGHSLPQGVGGVLGERLPADHVGHLLAGDVDDSGVGPHLHVARSDTFHATVLEGLDESVEEVRGGTECFGSCTHGDLGPLVQQLLLFRVPCVQQQKCCLQVDLSLVLDWHGNLPGIPYLICLFSFHAMFIND